MMDPTLDNEIADGQVFYTWSNVGQQPWQIVEVE